MPSDQPPYNVPYVGPRRLSDPKAIPNTLREALEQLCDAAERVAGTINTAIERNTKTGINYVSHDLLADAAKAARKALATDQSRGDEATPAEPTYEWRALAWDYGDKGVEEWVSDSEAEARVNSENAADADPPFDYIVIERRVKPKPAPWERVDDGGRRDG